MIMEENMQTIEVEVSWGMANELSARAESMGLTESEYMECVMMKHVDAGLVPA